MSRDDLASSADPVGDFLAGCTEKEGTAGVDAADLAAGYVEWALAHGEQPRRSRLRRAARAILRFLRTEHRTPPHRPFTWSPHGVRVDCHPMPPIDDPAAGRWRRMLPRFRGQWGRS